MCIRDRYIVDGEIYAAVERSIQHKNQNLFPPVSTPLESRNAPQKKTLPENAGFSIPAPLLSSAETAKKEPVFSPEKALQAHFPAESWNATENCLAKKGCAFTRDGDDFRANFSLGAGARAYHLSAEERRMVLRILQCADFVFAGVDFVFRGNQLYLNEIEDAAGARMLYAVRENEKNGEDITFHLISALKKRALTGSH